MKKIKRKRWLGRFRWSELKSSEGGRGTGLVSDLKSNGLKARSFHSPYIGEIGVEVDIHNREEAVIVAKILDYDNVDNLRPLNEIY